MENLKKEFKYMVYKNYHTNEVQIYTSEQVYTHVYYRPYIFKLVKSCNMIRIGSYKSVNGKIDKGLNFAKDVVKNNGMKLKVLFDFEIEEKGINRFINAINVICFSGIAIGFITVAIWVLLK